MKTTYGAVANFIRLNPNLEAQVLRYTAFGSARIEVPGTNSVVYPMATNLTGCRVLTRRWRCWMRRRSLIWRWVRWCSKRPESKCIGIGTPSFEPEERDAGDRRAYRSGQDLPSFTFIEHSAPEGCDYRDERVWPLANPGLVTKPPILGIDALRMDVAMMPEQHFRLLAQWPTAAAGGWLGDNGSEMWDELTDPFEFVPAATWAGLDMSSATTARRWSPASSAPMAGFTSRRGSGIRPRVARLTRPR